MMQKELFSDETIDDLFTPPVRTTKPTNTRCVVCQLRADVLVCEECASDPRASITLVRNWLYSILDDMDAHIRDFEDFKAKHPTQWQRIEDAKAGPDWPARAARNRAAGNIYGQLLDAEAAMERALEPLGVERARLEKALEALRTL